MGIIMSIVGIVLAIVTATACVLDIWQDIKKLIDKFN